MAASYSVMVWSSVYPRGDGLVSRIFEVIVA